MTSFCCNKFKALTEQSDLSIDENGKVSHYEDLGFGEDGRYDDLDELTFVMCPYCGHKLKNFI